MTQRKTNWDQDLEYTRQLLKLNEIKGGKDSAQFLLKKVKNKHLKYSNNNKDVPLFNILRSKQCIFGRSVIFSHLVFYLFGPLESVYCTSLFSDHHLNTGPFDNRTQINHSNTRLVQYSDGYV